MAESTATATAAFAGGRAPATNGRFGAAGGHATAVGLRCWRTAACDRRASSGRLPGPGIVSYVRDYVVAAD